MSFDMDLTALPEGLTELALTDADTYTEELPQAPPKPGNYQMRITDAKLVTNADDVIVLDDGKYAQLSVPSIEIVAPLREGSDPRKVFVFQKFPSKPISGRDMASRLSDLIRAHDQSATWGDGIEMFSLLQQLTDQGETFRGFLNWVAKDTSWMLEEMDRAGGFGNASDEDRRRIFGEWKIVGQNRFPKNDKGYAIPLWEGPSGDKIEARAEITKLYPSNKLVKLVTYD